MGPAIGENTGLKHLILSWNNLRRKGAIAIAKGLQVNLSQLFDKYKFINKFFYFSSQILF